MYESEDLYHWHYEGVILACSQEPENPLYAPMRFERPKIVYNRTTGQYVLWCHYVKYPGDHGSAEGTAEAGVAVCDRVNGSYTWLGTSRPIDEKGLVRDSTVYQDEDGSAYFIYDRQVEKDRCLHIVRLSDDYLSFTSQYKRIDAAFWREAAALVRHDGYYYMVTSDLTSWDANQAKYFCTKNLMGEWEDMGDPAWEMRHIPHFIPRAPIFSGWKGKRIFIFIWQNGIIRRILNGAPISGFQSLLERGIRWHCITGSGLRSSVDAGSVLKRKKAGKEIETETDKNRAAAVRKTDAAFLHEKRMK